jgi:hypothetical protein
MSRHFFKPIAVAGALGACAFAVPTASAMQDQRSPDARDASTTVQQRIVANDLRSPDARDAGQTSSHQQTVASDLRSPDAQDAAGNVSLRSYPTPAVVEVPASHGFDWGDAGVGAGGMLAAVVIGVGGTLLIIRRRPGRSGTSPVAG